MTSNNSFQVFKGGWDQLESAVLTDNQGPIPLDPKAFFIKPDGRIVFVMNGNHVETYPLSVPWDVSTIGNLISRFAVSEDPTPTGIFFRDDGTKMFVVGDTPKRMYEYVLPVPWDITSIVTVGTLNLAIQDSSPKGITFSSDGFTMFIVGDANIKVFQYSLVNPFDISNVSSVFGFTLVDSGFQEGITFSTDGLKMFITNTSVNSVFEYTLNSAFDLSAGASKTDTFVVSQDTRPHGITFSSTGSRMFIVGNTNGEVFQYNLSANFDISSPVLAGSLPITAQDTNAFGIAFSSNGSKMFIVGENQRTVFQYNLGINFDVTTVLSIDSKSIISQDTQPLYIAFSTDGFTMFIVGTQNDFAYQYSLSDPFEVLSIIIPPPVDSLGLGVIPGSIVNQCAFSTDGTFVFVVGNDDVFSFKLDTPWSLNTNTTGSTSFDPAQSVESIAFKPNGNKMYLGDRSGQLVIEFDLTTPFIIASGVTSSGNVLNLTFDSLFPAGLFWRGNGTQFFVFDEVANNMTRLHLITPWDISTASLFANKFPVSADPRAVFWTPDGLKMFELDNVSKLVAAYTTPIPFNTSTLTQLPDTFDVAPKEPNPAGMFWSNDGTFLFIVGLTNTTVTKYFTNEPFSIETGVIDPNPVDEFILTDVLAPTGVWFNSDGTIMLISDPATPISKIHQFNLSGPYVLPTFPATPNKTLEIENDGFALDLFLKADGLQMFLPNAQADTIERYVLDTPFTEDPSTFDITTAVLVDKLDLTFFTNNIQGIFIHPNGKQLFLCEILDDSILTFDMSLEFNNTIITTLGEDLITDITTEDILVYA